MLNQIKHKHQISSSSNSQANSALIDRAPSLAIRDKSLTKYEANGYRKHNTSYFQAELSQPSPLQRVSAARSTGTIGLKQNFLGRIREIFTGRKTIVDQVQSPKDFVVDFVPTSYNHGGVQLTRSCDILYVQQLKKISFPIKVDFKPIEYLQDYNFESRINFLTRIYGKTIKLDQIIQQTLPYEQFTQLIDEKQYIYISEVANTEIKVYPRESLFQFKNQQQPHPNQKKNWAKVKCFVRLLVLQLQKNKRQKVISRVVSLQNLDFDDIPSSKKLKPKQPCMNTTYNQFRKDHYFY